MRQPIIALSGKRKDRGQHAGLLLQRYLCEDATGERGNPKQKRDLLQAAIAAAANDDVRALYDAAFHRWSASLPGAPAPVDLATAGRIIVGLGSENILETGIRLHHTYGMPIIPGSALKGVAAHYCHELWRATDKRFRRDDGDYHRLLFGTTDDSGCIIFHDSWYVPGSSPSPLMLDVMTPHHAKWLDGSVAPTDFDSPTPVPFLSVSGKFRLAVSWHGPASDQATKWAELALSLLQDALADWGVGGKASSGYGRLALPPPPPHPGKRASGEKARVRIIAKRPKGGFDVQDIGPGRNCGSLTLGSPSAGADTNIGSVVEVEVHNDEPRNPQYRWPRLPRR